MGGPHVWSCDHVHVGAYLITHPCCARTLQGIDHVIQNRPFVPRAQPDDEGEGEGGADLGIQVLKGVSMAAKFAAKIGKKIKQNVVVSLAWSGSVVWWALKMLGDADSIAALCT